jgi:hypothetical protein
MSIPRVLPGVISLEMMALVRARIDRLTLLSEHPLNLLFTRFMFLVHMTATATAHINDIMMVVSYHPSMSDQIDLMSGQQA